MGTVEYGGVTEIVRYVMKRTVTGGVKLFTEVEQGSGKYSSNTLIFLVPSRIREAQIWINEECVK